MTIGNHHTMMVMLIMMIMMTVMIIHDNYEQDLKMILMILTVMMLMIHGYERPSSLWCVAICKPAIRNPALGDQRSVLETKGDLSTEPQ